MAVERGTISIPLPRPRVLVCSITRRAAVSGDRPLRTTVVRILVEIPGAVDDDERRYFVIPTLRSQVGICSGENQCAAPVIDVFKKHDLSHLASFGRSTH